MPIGYMPIKDKLVTLEDMISESWRKWFQDLLTKPEIGQLSRARGYRTGNVLMSYNAFYKVALNAETYDNLNEFDPITNYRFTAQTEGYYQVNAAAQISSFGIGVFLAAIYKNGVIHSQARIYNTENTGVILSALVSDVIYLGVNGYLELYIYFSGSDATRLIVGASDATFMSIHRLS